MRITRSPFHNPEPPNRPSMRSCQSCQCHPRLRGFSSHQSASRVAQIAHPGVDAFQVVRCRKISGDDLLKKSCDNEADSWLPCWNHPESMLGWRKSMQWNVSWWTGWNWCRVSATRCYFCKAHRGLEQNRPQRFSTSGGPRGSGEREVGFRLLHVCGPSSHLTHRSPRLCFSPPLQRLSDLVSSGRPRKLSCYSDGHSSNCTLRLIDMTFACTQWWNATAVLEQRC